MLDKMKFSSPPPRKPLMQDSLARPDQFRSNLRDEGALWLDRGECVDPAFQALAGHMFSQLPAHALWAYPTPGPFYRKLADHLSLQPDFLRLTGGTDGAIQVVFQTFMNPGDKALIPDPTFQMYAVYAQMYDVVLERVPYRLVQGRPYMGADEFIDKIESVAPKLVGLPYPDNPTGWVFSEIEIRRIIEAAGTAGSLILLDEAYYAFHGHSCLPWVREYGHLIVTRSFSKAWGMAGLRLGFTAAQPEITALLHKVRPMIEASGPAMALVERMLDHEDAMHESVARLIEGRNWFCDEISRLGYICINTPCNFVHVDFGDKRYDVEKALKGVARVRTFPDSILKDFLRFTVTTKPLFAKVIQAIETVK